MRRNGFSLFLGLIFLAAGIGYLGREFFYWNFNIFFDGWWTLFLILPSIYSMIYHKVNLFNSAVLAFGVLKLMEAQKILPHHTLNRLFFPALIILLGIYIITTAFSRPKSKGYTNCGNNASCGNSQENSTDSNSSNNFNNSTNNTYSGEKRPVDNNQPDYFCLFGGYTIKNDALPLKPTTIFALFASVDADFTRASVNAGAEINIISIFSGIRFYPPDNANIVVRSTPIIGSVSNQTVRPNITSYETLKADATAILGSIDIISQFTDSSN